METGKQQGPAILPVLRHAAAKRPIEQAPVDPEVEIPITWLVNLVLLLARTAGLVVFVPIPGMRQFPPQPKIVLALTLTILLAPLGWGHSSIDILSGADTVWKLTGWILAESVFGLAVGVAVALLLEAFGLGAQILGFQAGYSYVNMIDPTTQVDASILNVLLALLGSMLFFAFDLHLHLIRALATSLESWPLGHFETRPADALLVINLGAAVLETAVRAAFPVMAVLLLIDITLGLLNQVNSRLQLLTLAFPAKILGAVALLYPVVLLGPRLFYDLAEKTQQVINLLVSR